MNDKQENAADENSADKNPQGPVEPEQGNYPESVEDQPLSEESSTESDDEETLVEDDSSTCNTYEQDSREDLIGKLVAANDQIAEMKDGFVRARADVENIQRRSQNEIISARKFAVEGFARELLSVVDSLDQASKVEIEETSGDAMVKMQEGLELTVKQFDQVMEKFGVTAVEAAAGIKFDPEIHQAISMVDGGEIESGHIVNVMQKGFKLKDRLLRPAMVVIAN